MKTTVVVFALAILALGSLAQTVEPPLSESSPDAAKEALSKFPPIENSENLLHFESAEHVIVTLDYLDSLILEASARNCKYIGEVQNLNCIDVLINYERSLGLFSLRAFIERQLAGSPPRTAALFQAGPFFQYTYALTLRSLLNEFEEIAIGGKFYRITKTAHYVYLTLVDLISSRGQKQEVLPQPVLNALDGCGTYKFSGPAVSSNGSFFIFAGSYHIPILGSPSAPSPLYRAGAWTVAYKFTTVAPYFVPHCTKIYASVYGKVSSDYWYQSFCKFYQNTCRASVTFNTSYGCYKYICSTFVEHTIDVFQHTLKGWVKGRHYSLGPSVPPTAPTGVLTTTAN